jgi:hypothetical protein
MEQLNYENRLPLTDLIPALSSKWDVCCREWQCDRLLHKNIGFPCQYYSINASNISFIYHQWYRILAIGGIIKLNFLPAFFPSELMVMDCHVGAQIELVFCKIVYLRYDVPSKLFWTNSRIFLCLLY